MRDLVEEVQRRVDAIPRGELSPLSSDAILLIRTHLPRIVAALAVVADAAVRAQDRGTFDVCDNDPGCRDQDEPLSQSQWCDKCRASHEIDEALSGVDTARKSAGM